MSKRGNYFIAMYDRNDNYIRDFDSIEKCALFLHISKKHVSDYIFRKKLSHNGFRLFKINDIEPSDNLSKSL